MIRKKKLKKKLKKLKLRLRRHKKNTRYEIEQLQLLIEQQAVAHSLHIKKIHKDHLLWLNHCTDQLMCKKLDRSLLSAILSNLALEVMDLAAKHPEKDETTTRRESHDN